MKYIKLVALFLISLHVSNVFAYRIITPDIHESMTRASKSCFDDAKNKKIAPSKCDTDIDKNIDVNVSWMHDSSLKMLDLKGRYLRIRGITATYPDLEDAVRWPDDPTHELSLGAPKFSAKLLFKACNSYKKDDGSMNIDAGLICSSHFGDLQFLHAQASRVGEAAIDTHTKIIDWAEFLYNVAANKMNDAALDQDYCEYFVKDTLFHKAMMPNESIKACIKVAGNKEKWKVASLFNITCSSPLPSAMKCSEWSGPSLYDKARIQATGAILHLIQDSYSQGHIKRGKCEINKNKTAVIAKVECMRIEQFTTYEGQYNHGDTDLNPIFKSSCKKDNTMNPVLAGALSLWYINQGSEYKNFRDEVLYKVFGTPEDIKENAVESGLGACFEEELDKNPYVDTDYD